MLNPEQSSVHFTLAQEPLTLAQEPQIGLRFLWPKPQFRKPGYEPADGRKNHGYYGHLALVQCLPQLPGIALISNRLSGLRLLLPP